MIFHKHKWKKISRTFAGPVAGEIEGRGVGRYLEKMAFGVTTILWECEVCQELRKEELLGKEKGGE